MRGVNKAILLGNLGKDPELTVFESGSKKATFSLATSERYRDRSGHEKTETEWHNIVVWGNLADIVEKYLRKGSPVYVEGKIRSREFTAQDGTSRRITEILAENINMLTLKEEHSSSNVSSQQTAAAETKVPESSPDEFKGKDDLPF